MKGHVYKRVIRNDQPKNTTLATERSPLVEAAYPCVPASMQTELTQYLGYYGSIQNETGSSANKGAKKETLVHSLICLTLSSAHILCIFVLLICSNCRHSILSMTHSLTFILWNPKLRLEIEIESYGIIVRITSVEPILVVRNHLHCILR